MSSVINTTADKTPIEVMLEIDENGMTTAKRLYAFLELHPSAYARWTKRFIEKNQYAERNIDFKPFNTNVECGGQASTDYKLTAAFAKKLAMGTNNERGEQAKDYFIKVEEKLKQIAISKQAETAPQSNLPSTISNMTLIEAMVAEMKSQHAKISQHSDDIANLDERLTKIENVKEADIIEVRTVKPSEYVRRNIYSPTSIAKAFGMGATTLNEILATEGIIKRVHVYFPTINRVDLYWIIHDKYKAQKYSAQKYIRVRKSDGAPPVEITYAWTKRGVGFIVNLMKYKGYAQHGEIDNRTKARTRKKAAH